MGLNINPFLFYWAIMLQHLCQITWKVPLFLSFSLFYSHSHSVHIFVYSFKKDKKKKPGKQKALISCHLLALPLTITLLKGRKQRRLKKSLGVHSLLWQKRQKYIIIINLICDCGWQAFPIGNWWAFTMPTCTHQCVTMHAGA